MGQQPSTKLSIPTAKRPTARSTTPDTTRTLYKNVNGALIKCPISRKQFLPLDILQQVITMKAVRAIPDVCNVNQAEQVVRGARKVFAILVLVGREDAISYLLADGLIDEYLPLYRREDGNDQILVSRHVGVKAFETFQDWEPHQVTYFLEKQWLFQAPVFDATGRHYDIAPECALPIQSQDDQIWSTSFSTVFRCKLRPSHYQQESKVSND
jgi:hypothetical protein